jgi:hypothetical protein
MVLRRVRRGHRDGKRVNAERRGGDVLNGMTRVASRIYSYSAGTRRRPCC